MANNFTSWTNTCALSPINPFLLRSTLADLKFPWNALSTSTAQKHRSWVEQHGGVTGLGWVAGRQCVGVESGIFVWGPSYGTNIFIKTTSYTHTYIHIHAFFFFFNNYIHTFLFDKLYIYTHPTKKKKFSIFNQNYVWRWSFIK